MSTRMPVLIESLETAPGMQPLNRKPQASPKPSLTIVILNYQATQVTLDCLHSLSVCPTVLNGRAQVVIWENGTGPDAVSTLRDAIEGHGWGDWVELRTSPRNLGFTGGNNRVIEEALRSSHPPDYFLLLNSDTLVTDETFTTLLEFMERHPKAGIAGSRLLTETGATQCSPFRFPGIASEFEQGVKLGYISRLLSRWRVAMPTPEEETPVDWVSGACMLLRRTLLEQIGCLDEGFFTYFEDLDLCKRAHDHGWEVWYVPQSRVVHLEGASSQITQRLRKRRPAFWFHARRRYFLKHAGPLKAALIDAAYIAGLTLWQVRRLIQRKPDTDPPHLWRDFIANSVFFQGFRITDVNNQTTPSKTGAKASPDRFDLIYVEGPGDVVESFRRWNAQEDLLSETSKTYSSQLFDFCRAQGLKTYAISYCDDRKREWTPQFRVENIPKKILGPGLLYHVSQILYGLRIVAIALRYRPEFLNITSGVTYWFVLAPLRLLSIKVIPHFHNCLWPNGYRPKGLLRRVLLALDGAFLRRFACAALCVSPEIERQLREIAGPTLPVFQFRGQFHPRDFDPSPPPPPHGQKPFTLVFAGRIERNKGVFDLLDMADRLRHKNVVFELCGGGSALTTLTEAVRQRGLADVVRIHGKLRRPDLLSVYARGHAVIVPTRSDFCEGLPMVAAEAVLLGRPVITTRLSNALDVLVGAIAEAQPDDVDSYVTVIQRLHEDRGYYESLCRACPPLRSQFLDGQRGLAAVLPQAWRTCQ